VHALVKGNKILLWEIYENNRMKYSELRLDSTPVITMQEIFKYMLISSNISKSNKDIRFTEHGAEVKPVGKNNRLCCCVYLSIKLHSVQSCI